MKILKYVALVALLSFPLQAVSQALKKLKTTVSNTSEGKEINIVIEPYTDFKIRNSTVYYRSSENLNSFKVVEAYRLGRGLTGDRFQAVIPASDALAPLIEYYVIANIESGDQISYPGTQPRDFPASIVVRPSESDNDAIALFSPDEGGIVKHSELIVIFSYYELSDAIDISQSQFLFNGNDVSSSAIMTDNIASYIPPVVEGKVTAGFVAKDLSGTLLARKIVSFTVLPVEGAYNSTEFNYDINVWAEGRVEQKQDSLQWVARGNLFFTTQWADLVSLDGHAYITSDEDYGSPHIRQSANRYYGVLKVPYFKLDGGDFYPNYNYYLNAGQRVRGIRGESQIKAFRIAAMWGETNQETSPTLIGRQLIIRKSDPNAEIALPNLLQQGLVIVDTVGNSYVLQRSNDRGPFSYRREFISGIIGVNDRDFRLDIQIVRQTDKFAEDVYNIKGQSPQQSLGFSSTLKANIVKNILSIYADAAYTISNRDISGGSFSSIEVLGDYVKNYRDQVVNFVSGIPFGYNFVKELITVNEYITQSSLRDLSSLAVRAGWQLDLSAGSIFSNKLQFEYARQGGQFEAFTPFYLRDVQSFKLSDRAMFLSGRIILSLGGEYFTDNLSGDKNINLFDNRILNTTTHRINLNAGLYFNFGGMIPQFRIDVKNQINRNLVPFAYEDVVSNISTDLIQRSGFGKQVNNMITIISADIREHVYIQQHALNLSLSGVYQFGQDRRDFSLVDNLNIDLSDPNSLKMPVNGIYYSLTDVQAIPLNLMIYTITGSAQFIMASGIEIGASATTQKADFYVSKNERKTDSFNSIGCHGSAKFLNDDLATSLRARYTFGSVHRMDISLEALYRPIKSLSLSLNGSVFLRDQVNEGNVTSFGGIDFLGFLRIDWKLGNY